MASTHTFKDLLEVTEDAECGLVVEKNVSIPRNGEPPIRCNVYRPISAEGTKFPVLVTYGPYGKDIPYDNSFKQSFSEVNPEHKLKYSAWETPDPVYWTKEGYVVVRADERGTGQSPGVLDTMSRGTSECFFDVVEWAAEQAWSLGKVGLVGKLQDGYEKPMLTSTRDLILCWKPVACGGKKAERIGMHNPLGGHVRLLSR